MLCSVTLSGPSTYPMTVVNPILSYFKQNISYIVRIDISDRVLFLSSAVTQINDTLDLWCIYSVSKICFVPFNGTAEEAKLVWELQCELNKGTMMKFLLKYLNESGFHMVTMAQCTYTPDLRISKWTTLPEQQIGWRGIPGTYQITRCTILSWRHLQCSLEKPTRMMNKSENWGRMFTDIAWQTRLISRIRHFLHIRHIKSIAVVRLETFDHGTFILSLLSELFVALPQGQTLGEAELNYIINGQIASGIIQPGIRFWTQHGAQSGPQIQTQYGAQSWTQPRATHGRQFQTQLGTHVQTQRWSNWEQHMENSFMHSPKHNFKQTTEYNFRCNP
jgi:hypothetical protein